MRIGDKFKSQTQMFNFFSKERRCTCHIIPRHDGHLELSKQQYATENVAGQFCLKIKT